MGKRFLLVGNIVCFLLNVFNMFFCISIGQPLLALLPALLIVINYVAIKQLLAHLAANEKDPSV